MLTLNINSDAAVVLTNKLEKLHRSGLPVAVRSALNSAAFDVKKRTMPLSAKSTFTQRRKTFFKAKSRVQVARGFNLRNMKAAVGFTGADKNQSVSDLEQQERGGTIGGRSFIPMSEARIGKSNSKSVRKLNRLSNIRNIDVVKSKKLFHRVAHAAGVGGHIIYRDTLFRIKSLSRKGIKLQAIYSYKKGRSVNIEQTGFMMAASLKSGQRLNSFFKTEAEKQIKRLTR